MIIAGGRMPIALSLYFHGLYRDKIQKEFDKHNRVLSQKDIEDLLLEEDIGRVLRIFCSAVADHQKVDGMPYHLSYPVNDMFYHDGFKRALIADGIGRMAERMDHAMRKDAVCVLKVLADPFRSPAGYARVLAWNALGGVIASEAKLMDMYRDDVLDALGGTVPSVIGALLFIDAARKRKDTRIAALVQDGMGSARYRVQRALLHYFRHTRPEFETPLQQPDLETDIRTFLQRLPQYGLFTQADVQEGLRAVGMFASLQKAEFQANTPHADIGQRVTQAASEFVGAAGAFLRSQSNEP